jgi:hypothetical protein
VGSRGASGGGAIGPRSGAGGSAAGRQGLLVRPWGGNARAEEDWREDGGPAATREEVRQPAGGGGGGGERGRGRVAATPESTKKGRKGAIRDKETDIIQKLIQAEQRAVEIHGGVQGRAPKGGGAYADQRKAAQAPERWSWPAACCVGAMGIWPCECEMDKAGRWSRGVGLAEPDRLRMQPCEWNKVCKHGAEEIIKDH